MEKILLFRTLYHLKPLNTPMANNLSLKIHGVHRALEINWHVECVGFGCNFMWKINRASLLSPADLKRQWMTATAGGISWTALSRVFSRTSALWKVNEFYVEKSDPQPGWHMQKPGKSKLDGTPQARRKCSDHFQDDLWDLLHTCGDSRGKRLMRRAPVVRENFQKREKLWAVQLGPAHGITGRQQNAIQKNEKWFFKKKLRVGMVLERWLSR